MSASDVGDADTTPTRAENVFFDSRSTVTRLSEGMHERDYEPINLAPR